MCIEFDMMALEQKRIVSTSTNKTIHIAIQMLDYGVPSMDRSYLNQRHLHPTTVRNWSQAAHIRKVDKIDLGDIFTKATNAASTS